MMSEPTTPTPTDADLRQLIATTVAETAGVVRLEPTLKSFMQNLTQPAPTGTPDGVTIARRQELVEVTTDVTVDPRHTALLVAVDVQRRVADCIRGVGLSPGAVNVTVLAITRALR